MTTGAPATRPRDPARGLRGIGAGLLVAHAIVVALALPVVLTRQGGAPAIAVAGLAAIAVLDIVAAGLLRRAERQVVVLGSVLQAATIAAGILSAVLLFLGVVFAALWVGWLAMRRSLARMKAAYEARIAAQPSGGRGEA